VAYFKSNSP